MSAPVGTLHHVGVVVADLDAAEALFGAAFGLPVAHRLASEELGMRAVFLAAGPVTIELVEFADPEVARERLRGGSAAIDHVALAVGDLDAAIQALAAHGVRAAQERPLVTPAGRTVFTRAETSGGIAWQLLEPAAR
jgi:catechol 2,3-dioxygenase-like lactoylglutathione lyase family enzyme